MKHIKKTLCIYSICLISVLMFSFSASAEQTDIDGVKYTYNITNDYVEITAITPISNFNIIVPSEIEGYPVTKVGGFGHTVFGSENIVSAVLPNTVTELDTWAFADCEKLNEVTLSQNLQSISDFAFNHCKKLKKINIPSSVKKIGYAAFNYCESLKEITLSENITHIGEDAFYACKTLKRIDLPDGLKEIGEHTFFNCINLQSVLIPKSVTYIGEKAFSESVRDDMGTMNGFLKTRTYKDIRYTGSEKDWSKITVSGWNGNLTNSTIKFNHPTCYVKISETEKYTELSVTPENIDKSSIIVAAYKGNVLTFSDVSIENTNTFVIPDSVDYDTIRVFAFDNMSTLIPICLQRNFNLK